MRLLRHTYSAALSDDNTKQVLERANSFVLHFTFVYDACTHGGICVDASDLYVRCHRNKKKGSPNLTA
jgi:hypothetical protein